MSKGKIISWINAALFCAVIGLGASVGTTLRQANAQEGWQPPSCEDVIDMTRTCPAGTTGSWNYQGILCKTASAPDQNWCCEYTTNYQYCVDNATRQITSSGGYYATWQNSYVTPFICGQTIHGQCS